MDKETIGFIEEILNDALEQKDILDRTNWVRDKVIIKAPEDFVLGYMLGSLMNTAYRAVRIEKASKRSKKRLEKEFGKERAKKALERTEVKVKPKRVLLTEKEENKIRDMLKRRIPEYRQKIYRELHK